MSENTEKTPKARSTKLRIYVTTDVSGRTLGRNRATSSSQAQSFYTKGLVTRECTDDEIFDIAKNDYAIGGMPKAEGLPDTAQQDLLTSPDAATNFVDDGFDGNIP